jgi:hypothetical protein
MTLQESSVYTTTTTNTGGLTSQKLGKRSKYIGWDMNYHEVIFRRGINSQHRGMIDDKRKVGESQVKRKEEEDQLRFE